MIRLISNLMTSQPGQHIQYTYCPISREVKTMRQLDNESNQTMKFGQSIECNMRNIFLEKSYRNVVVKLVPDISFVIFY